MQEELRLKTIATFNLDKGEEDPSLDALMQSLARLFAVPIALVSIIGAHEQFFKARCGLAVQSTDRKVAFCDVVVSLDEPLIVEDTLLDSRFVNNPLVTGEPFIRAYAGVPLKLLGTTIGSLCVIDTKPRQLSRAEFEVLTQLSLHVGRHLELLREHRTLQQSQSLVNNSPAVLMKWQQLRSLTLMYVSANIHSLFGIAAEPLCHDEVAFAEFIHPDDVAEFEFLLENHTSGLAIGEANFRIRPTPQHSYWVKLRSKAFFNAAGKLEAIHAMLTDFTASKYLEQKLTEANQQMRLVLDASGLGTWDWDLQQDQLRVNRRWCEMLGLDFEQYDSSSQFWRSLVHPADIHRIEQELVQLKNGDIRLLNSVYRMRHSRGFWVWIEAFGKIVARGQDGAMLRIAGTHRDISARKEAQLQDSKQRRLLSFINKAHSAYLERNHLSHACQDIIVELADIAESELAFIGQFKRVQGTDKLQILACNLVNNIDDEHEFPSPAEAFFSAIVQQKTAYLNNHLSHYFSLTNDSLKVLHYLGLPIVLNGELVGMLGLGNKLTAYQPADAEFLQPLLDAFASVFYAVHLQEARDRAEQQLTHLAMSDAVTGLANKRAFIDYCRLLTTTTHGCVLAIVEIDLFEQVLHQFDSTIRDLLVKTIAKTLQHELRQTDFIARFTEEAFVLVIHDLEIDAACLLLENLRLEVETLSIPTPTSAISVSVSMGARYVTADEHLELSQHVAEADLALNQAKSMGGNCIMWS